MRAIHKFQLHAILYKHLLGNIPHKTLMLPPGYEVLHVDNQHGMLCMWVLLDPDKATKVAEVFIFGTGQQIVDETINKSSHIGTVLVDEMVDNGYVVDEMVYHVFISQKG